MGKKALIDAGLVTLGNNFVWITTSTSDSQPAPSIRVSAWIGSATRDEASAVRLAGDAGGRAAGVRRTADDEAAGMELDHLVPLALAGSNAAANLWPQPSPDYEMKDRLEVEMQRRACVAYRTLTPAGAVAVLAEEQGEMTEDWTAAYARYMGP